MLRRRSGFRARVIKNVPHVMLMHRIIPQFAMSYKVYLAEPFSVLSMLIEMVNHVKGRTLNSR